MASRPPEPPEDVARARWVVINIVRVAGVVMVIVGILGVEGYFAYPDIAAYVLIAAGVFDIFVVPLLLARKWRSPPE